MSCCTSLSGAPLNFSLHIDPARGVIVQDDRLVPDHVDLGNVAEAYVPAAGGVDQQLADAGKAVPGGRSSFDDHREDLLLLVDVADFDALQQGSSRAPDVTGDDAGLLGRGQVNLDLDDRLLGGRVDMGIDDAAGPGQDLLHFLCLLAERGHIQAVNPDGKAGVGGLPDLVDLPAGRWRLCWSGPDSRRPRGRRRRPCRGRRRPGPRSPTARRS